MRLGYSLLFVALSLISSTQLVVAALFDNSVPSLNIRESYLEFDNHELQTRDLPTGTCNAETPCKYSFTHVPGL